MIHSVRVMRIDRPADVRSRAKTLLARADLPEFLTQLRRSSSRHHDVAVRLITAAQETANAPEYRELDELLTAVATHHLELCLELCQSSPQGAFLLGQVQRHKLLESDTPLAAALDEMPVANMFEPCLVYIVEL